ncbi:MAG: Ig-like domain-containing protein, partial [Pirellulales bacterium]
MSGRCAQKRGLARVVGGFDRKRQRAGRRRYQMEQLEARQMLSAAPVAQDELFTVAQGGQLNVGVTGTTATEEWGVRVSPTAPLDYNLTVTGGQTVQSGGGFTMGNAAGAVGRATITGPGSTWQVAQWVEVGRRGDGRVIIEDGARWSTGNWVEVGSSDGPGFGEVIVRGAGSRWDMGNWLELGGEGGRGSLVVADGAVVNGGTNWVNMGQTTGDAMVIGAGSQWSFGRLSVEDTGAATIRVADGGILSGPITLGRAGRLLGDGTIRGTIQNSGLIGPGAAHGVMRVEGTLSLTTDSTVEIPIAGNVRGVSYGAIDVTGGVTYGGKLAVNFVNGFAPRAGDEFELIRGTTGSFSQVVVTGLSSGFQYTLAHTGGALRLRATNDGVAVATPAPAGLLESAIDADGDKLGVRLVERPTDGSVALSENGAFRYVPAAGFRGRDTFRYRVTDGFHASEVATVTIQVGAPGPVATADVYEVNEGTALTIDALGGLLANDTSPSGAPLSAARTLAASHGAVTLNADGSFTYSPQPNFTGTDTFRYRATDGAAQSNIATVTITVRSVNDAPVAVGETYTATQDTPLVISTQSVGSRIYQTSANPSAGAGGGSSISPTQFLAARFQVTSPTTTGRLGGLFGGQGTGFAALVALTGPDDFPDSFDLSTPDVLGHSTLTFPNGNTLFVSAPLEVPLSPGWYSIVYGTGLFGTDGQGWVSGNHWGSAEILYTSKIWTDGSVRWASQPDRGDHMFIDAKGAPAGLLANDSDVELSPLTASVESYPSHGTLSVLPGGGFNYTPNPGFVGTDSFTYRASDGENMSAPATVSIVVRSAIAPVAVADSFVVDEDNGLLVAASQGVIANDAGREAVAELVIGPAHGTLNLAADGSFVYTPAPDFAGVDRFWYRLQTADGVSAPATATIQVNAVIDPPAAATMVCGRVDRRHRRICRRAVLPGADQ